MYVKKKQQEVIISQLKVVNQKKINQKRLSAFRSLLFEANRGQKQRLFSQRYLLLFFWYRYCFDSTLYGDIFFYPSYSFLYCFVFIYSFLMSIFIASTKFSTHIPRLFKYTSELIKELNNLIKLLGKLEQLAPTNYF